MVYAIFEQYDVVHVINPITGNERQTIVHADLGERIVDTSGRFVHKSNIVEA